VPENAQIVTFAILIINSIDAEINMQVNLLKILAILIINSVSANMALAHDDAGINEVSITTDGQMRYIKSNGIPSTHGAFPNAHNPSTISAQEYNFQMPLYPQIARSVTQLQGFEDFGVGLNGIPFDPGTAEFWKGDRQWRYEALSGKINLGMDQNNAHVQPSGAYHYHGLPTDLLQGQSNSQHSKLVGYAADGFPIYAQYGYVKAADAKSGIKELKSGYKLRTGNRTSGPSGAYDGTFTADYEFAGTGDLDECNGRVGVTPEYPGGTYTYFITTGFPIVPRCFRGTPDDSFIKNDGGPGHGPRGPGNRMGPPPDRRPPQY